VADIELTAEDIEEMTGEMEGNVYPEPTEDELREVIRRVPGLYYLAREWTWGDTEARDQLAAALYHLRTERVKVEHPLPWHVENRVIFDGNGKVVVGETCGAPSPLVAGWLVEVAERTLGNGAWS
jgi:hypothetical protein